MAGPTAGNEARPAPAAPGGNPSPGVRRLTQALLILGGIPFVAGAVILIFFYNPPASTGLGSSLGDRLGLALSTLLPWVVCAVPAFLMLRGGRSPKAALVLSAIPPVLLVLVFVLGYAISRH